MEKMAVRLEVPAHFLLGEPTSETTHRHFARAQSAGIQTSLDASSVGALHAWDPEESRRRLAALAPTLLFANEDECDHLRLITAPLAGVVLAVQRGPDAAEARGPEGERLAVRPAHRLPPGLDSTGAGDAFAAGMLRAARAEAEGGS